MAVQKDSYLRALGVNGNDADEKKLREAYERAHEIRKFEIQMYWTRSSYLWTLQGAALGALAVILSTNGGLQLWCVETCPADIQNQRMAFILVVAVWAFGLFTAAIWILILKGGKFW